MYLADSLINYLSYFYVSAILCATILATNKIHIKITADYTVGPQKIHNNQIPRIGGLAIFLSLAFNYLYYPQESTCYKFLLCITPAFLIGIIEDLTGKIIPAIRIIFLGASSILCIQNLGLLINPINIPILNYLFLIPKFSFIFTVFCIVGMANAFNIIDGLNGLSAATSAACLLGVAYIGSLCHDSVVVTLSLSFLLSIFGFIIFNYPFGKIFLGDCGSYLMGIGCAGLTIMLVNRNPDVSQWTAITLLAYPFTETIFTIFRRIYINKTHISRADSLHLHSLIHKYLILDKIGLENNNLSNSLSATPLIILNFIPTIIASLYFSSRSVLILFLLTYCITYVYIYASISKIKASKIKC